jgi:hypothetical protein
MQRSALLALSEWIAADGRDPSSLKLIEVAAGTGRFHTFVKDNYPRMQARRFLQGLCRVARIVFPRGRAFAWAPPGRPGGGL